MGVVDDKTYTDGQRVIVFQLRPVNPRDSFQLLDTVIITVLENGNEYAMTAV